MSEFKNNEYSYLIGDLINDIFYTQGQSYRGKISKIRQYTEIIIRKIFNLPPEEAITIGNNKIKILLSMKNNNILTDSVEIIRKFGNSCTHTQEILEITENHFKVVVDALLNLYAYLFIEYFEKYKFGSNMKVADDFSLLPPVIRYKTLIYLYKNDNTNQVIIDKLALAILKAFDKEKALDWLEKNKEHLIRISSIGEKFKKDLIAKVGKDISKVIISSMNKNMYEVCYDKIMTVGKLIEEKGKLYDNFEEAKTFYDKRKNLKNTSLVESEFYLIMDFMYLGRKEYEIDINREKEYQIFMI